MTFDTVRKLALALPGVEEATSWGAPSLKVKGRFLACMAQHRSSEPNSLVLTGISFEERDAMVAEDPEVFYFTDHYVSHPVILVRLSKVRPDTLRGLLEAAWKRCSAQKKKAVRRTR